MVAGLLQPRPSLEQIEQSSKTRKVPGAPQRQSILDKYMIDHDMPDFGDCIVLAYTILKMMGIFLINNKFGHLEGIGSRLVLSPGKGFLECKDTQMFIISYK